MLTDSIPFQLWVCIGEGERVSRYPLCLKDTYTGAEPLKITELLSLSLELGTEDHSVEVSVIWERIDSIDDSDEVEVVVLNQGKNRSVLYEYSDKKEYPWSCGLYQYEVQWDGRSYQGFYEIVPKNVSADQMKLMHGAINDHLQGLVNDYLAVKRVGGKVEAELDNIAHWRFFSWYKEHENLLLQAAKHIEQNCEYSLREKYAVESVARRQTLRSFIWNNSRQGSLYQGTRFLNRRMEPDVDSAANQTVKLGLQAILSNMQLAIRTLRAIYNNFVAQYDELTNEIEDITARQQRLDGLKRVSKADKENVRTSMTNKQSSRQKISAKLRSLQSLEEEYAKYENTLRYLLNTPFWRDINDRQPKRMTFGHGWGYRTVHRLWSESKYWEQKRGKSAKQDAPVLRPTSILYEYYVFFTVINTFMDMGFVLVDDTIYTQENHSLLISGLQEGSYVLLKKGNDLIKITYDQMIESHAQSARQKQTYFYSTELKRKPDIRLDHTHEDTGSYQSSLIMEVKYRPFYNIYNEEANTDAMIQMAKYYAIMHVSQDGKYNRNPIQNVICVYPGDELRELALEGQQGLFLQLYPKSKEETIGKDALTDNLSSWIGL